MNVPAALWPLSVTLVAIVGYACGQPRIFGAAAWVYVAVLVLDSFVGTDTGDVAESSMSPRQGRRAAIDRLLLRAWVPMQVTLIGCGLATLAEHSTAAAAPFSTAVSLGVVIGTTVGIFGVPIAHELLHRQTRIDRALAELAFTLMSYPHFCIEHVHGHHAWVATPRDPATAHLGESFYTFWPRALAGSVASAWRLERKRITALGRSAWSPSNGMLRYLLTLAAAYLAVGAFFGRPGVVMVAVQSAVAITIIEVLNYIEHYGLERSEVTPGQYERVAQAHAWNSSHVVSNRFLLNVARHSDHHVHAARGHEALRHAHEAPQLPTGYFGMFALALCPPLWRSVMDHRVAVWRQDMAALANGGRPT